MSHLPEEEFISEYVIPWIEESHPDAEIEQERWVERTGAFCDVWVDLGTHILAIEVGANDSTIRAEAAQAREYSYDHPKAIPAVAVPQGHGERAVKRMVEDRWVPVWEIPTE